MPHGPPVMKVDGVLYNDTDPIGQQPSPFCLGGPGANFFSAYLGGTGQRAGEERQPRDDSCSWAELLVHFRKK